MRRLAPALPLLLVACAPPLEELGIIEVGATNTWNEVAFDAPEETTLQFWQDLRHSPGGEGSVRHVGQCWAWDIEVSQGGNVVVQHACNPGKTRGCREGGKSCFIEGCEIVLTAGGPTTVRARMLEPLPCKRKLDRAVLRVSRALP
jgi:hypothetical protein